MCGTHVASLVSITHSPPGITSSPRITRLGAAVDQTEEAENDDEQPEDISTFFIVCADAAEGDDGCEEKRVRARVAVTVNVCTDGNSWLVRVERTKGGSW